MSLATIVGRLRYAVPQGRGELANALKRAKARLPHLRIGDIHWSFPEGDIGAAPDPPDTVRLLAPFDSIVWDRRRFEILWNGHTGLRLTRLHRSASLVTTRCRCSGVIV